MGLKEKSIRGFIWTSIGTVGGGLTSLIITIILARTLAPYEFGLIEILLIFTNIFNVFIDSGFSKAIIRDQNPTQTDLSSIFFLNIIISFCIYILFFFCAPIIANFFEASELITLSRFVFLVLIIDSLSLVQNANLNRQLQFRPFAIASIIGIATAGLTAVILSFYGFGVWALAVNIVMLSFIRSILLWWQSKWRPSFIVNISSIKKYFKFGINLLFQELLDKVVSNAESIVIGRLYSKQSLGYFSQSRKFNAYICQTTTNVIQKVTYPTLAKIADQPQRLKDGYRRIIGITMYCILPLMLFTMVTSRNFIEVIFGAKWLESAEYLRLWAIWGILYPLSSISTNIFLVKGKTKLLLSISLFKQTLRIISVILLAKIGIFSMLQGLIIVSIISTFIYTFFGGKLINYKQIDMAKDLVKTLLSALISIFIVLLITNFEISPNIYIDFTLQLIVMFITYLLINKYVLKNIFHNEIMEIAYSYTKNISYYFKKNRLSP